MASNLYGIPSSTLPINRPTQDWSYPLQDAGWRRWFDILKQQGVTRLGGMVRPQQQRFLQAPAPNVDMGPDFESHEQFMARRPEIEDAGLKSIRKVTRQR